MAEYINLEKLIALKNDGEYMWYDLYDLEDFLADVKKECSADVVEVVHGYWKETITHNGCTWDSDCVCSVCGKSGHPCNNYCEECGAKMDGERKCEDG